MLFFVLFFPARNVAWTSTFACAPLRARFFFFLNLKKNVEYVEFFDSIIKSNQVVQS
jgi:hypothetical protein